MKKIIASGLMLLVMSVFFIGCEEQVAQQKTESGVKRAKVEVKTQSNGLTLEQSNIVKSYKVENKPGAIKHLYVISPFSGKVLLYSTIKGKVTSSKKSVNPTTVATSDGQYVGSSFHGFPVTVHGKVVRTPQVMQESGTYGDSDPYIYWWDTKGNYHKHFVTGGQMIHISDVPLPVRDIVIDLSVKKV